MQKKNLKKYLKLMKFFLIQKKDKLMINMGTMPLIKLVAQVFQMDLVDLETSQIFLKISLGILEEDNPDRENKEVKILNMRLI